MRTTDEYRQQAIAAIAALQLPETWKLQGYDTVLFDPAVPDKGIQSIGAVYTNMAMHGQDLKRYRVFYHTPTEHLGIVEKTIIDFGKYSYNCLISNKTIKQLNEFIAEYIKTDEHEYA